MKNFSHYEYAEYWHPEKFAKFYDVLLGNTDNKDQKILELLDWLADIAKDNIEFYLQRNQQPFFRSSWALSALDMKLPEVCFICDWKNDYMTCTGFLRMAEKNHFEINLDSDEMSVDVLELVEKAIPQFQAHNKTLWYKFEEDDEAFIFILTDTTNNDKFLQACHEFGFGDIDLFKKS